MIDVPWDTVRLKSGGRVLYGRWDDFFTSNRAKSQKTCDDDDDDDGSSNMRPISPTDIMINDQGL